MASNRKSSNGTEHDDWLGDLLVGAVGLAGIGLWRFALRWPDLAAVIAVTVVTAALADLRWACVVGGLAAVLVWGWRLGWPDSYQDCVGRPVADYRRAYLVYRRRWRTICEHHGLSISPRGDRGADPVLPTLREVRIGACVDILVVRLLVGQSAKTWESTADGLAAAFGAHTVVITAGPVDAGRGRDIVVRVRHHDALVAPIPLPRPRPDTRPTLAPVAVGVTEDATPWKLPVTGRHILIGGATGAGKGSVMWSLVAGLGPAIRSGFVVVRCIDPKGGMEFGAAAPLFERFAHDQDHILSVLRDTAATMLARANRLRGTTRQHRPSRAEPHIVVLIDELATLTAYVTDRKQRNEVDQLLGLLLSQGRAVGVCVIAAVQDPSKDVISLRQLFPIRVGLRMTESTQTAMILSSAAHHQGARCEDIPDHTPGVGYVLTEGTTTVARVRAYLVTDADINYLTTHFTPLPRPHGDPAGQK
ncbi:hypothetical cell division FtsK/SpoIIIE protein [Mycobacterium antarcticum]|uniref:type IV secretory system conjugative DNA transfer family protein n=1 Tax=Mycolicibacterium sp. TUM20983 TaxID=3023369 RepID=UPI0023A41033|nr:FtsK/SpoIIIE domain-containing protein [Mycolicibacterium sp. TUM20983]GLP78120.1 hypothetical cell division FtsK/SpoIIIE protein [Mycolicibacterium sp. TUM20983]